MPQIKLLNTGTNANDGTGDTARAGAKKINDNFTKLNRRSAFANGTLAKGVLGFAGDSMAGYSAGITQYSPIATLRMLHHDFDLIIDERAHADDADVQRPLGQRGYNFAKGSTKTSHLRDVQLPFIKAEPPEFLFLSTFQNDRFFAVGAADTSIAIVKDVVDQLLDLGITIIMAGVYPQNDIGAATENAFGKHYVESVMRNWAETRPGLHYVSILDALKNGDPTQEANSVVNWYGPVGATGGASFDGIHMAPFGARRVAKAYADVFRKLVGKAKTPAYEAFAFDQARNNYADYLGSSGRLIGSGGKINGTANANIPAGVELIYDATKNYTVTPTLTGNPDWPFRLTFSGTPSANDTLAVRFTSNKQLVAQPMEIHARARWMGMNGMSGIGVGQGEVGLPTGTAIMPVGNGIGGSGGSIFVMPFELNEEMTFRSGRPTGFQNQYGSTFRLDMTTAVVKDIPVSGSLEISRMGYFRSDNYL